jgi:hypothetical protein
MGKPPDIGVEPKNDIKLKRPPVPGKRYDISTRRRFRGSP